MQKKQLMSRKPAYRRNQLLLEDDFIAEQKLHLNSRYQHSRELHGFGVVRGLELSRAGDHAVTVSPGYAIDRRGHEIELKQGETLELQGLPAGHAWVSLGYRSERADADEDHRIDCFAVLRVATGVEDNDVRLGMVQLDERSRLAQPGISHQQRDELHSIAAGSVGPEALAPALRRGWVTMAFHPSPVPDDDDLARPPFRIGATRAMAHEPLDKESPGAAGTMTFTLPPGIDQFHRFRVAGESNKGTIKVELIKGGFDAVTRKRKRDLVLTLSIASRNHREKKDMKIPNDAIKRISDDGDGAYHETVDIPEAHSRLNDESRTLSVDIRSSAFASVLLVALEVSY
jgi:hypothetical protein